jgi:phosphocarrier protein
MVSAKVIINNPQGLHARPAGIVAKAASKCSSDTFLIHDNKRVQMKSILNIMAAALKFGTEIEIECTGETEQADLEKLVSVFENDIKNL